MRFKIQNILFNKLIESILFCIFLIDNEVNESLLIEN
jgi:hypothetical protein